MLWKYLLNSIKNNSVWFLTVILCQTVLILIVFCANGILLDTLNNKSNVSLSDSIAVHLEEPLTTSESEDKEKIDTFLSALPDMIECVFGIDGGSDKNDISIMFAFDDYDAMVSYWVDRRNVDKSILPTREQYESHEKLAMLGSDRNNFRFIDEDHILVGQNDDVYKVLGWFSSGSGIFIHYGTEPEGIGVISIVIDFKKIPTEQQIEEMDRLAHEILGAKADGIRLPVIQDLLDLRKNMANIILTVFMLVLIVFNTALIFRQAADRHKKEFAVFGFCGFSKKTAALYSLAEMLLSSFVSAAAAVIIFEFGLKSAMTQVYGAFSTVFTIDYYVSLILAFMAVSVLMFILCVAPILRKNTVCQLAEI